MTQLNASVIAWIRAGFPQGVPDSDAAALNAVLQERLGVEDAHDVLRKLTAEGQLSPEAARALIPEEEQLRRVAANLVLGGWPLGTTDDEDEAPPREGSPLARSVAWLREGYPGGVPEHDYMPLLALL